jgi:hypothetical protein
MKVKFTLALLLGALVIFISPAHATAITRSGSGYGMLSGATSEPVSIGSEYLICTPDTGSSLPTCDGTDEDDLLLQITSPASGPVQFSIPDLATTSFIAGTSPFGLVTCDKGTFSSQLGSVCTPTTPVTFTPTAADNACASDLNAAATSLSGSMTTITLPASCTELTDATIYFDQTSPEYGTFPGTPTSAPEPGSLMMLGIGFIPLALFSRRRAQV